MGQLLKMLEDTRRDREWFRYEARANGRKGLLIDAAACAIREQALLDAITAIKSEM
tara:strand:- start:3788 stop:3955 length:168 start_codon:yes stop_codon:yes gene_type:complete